MFSQDGAWQATHILYSNARTAGGAVSVAGTAISSAEGWPAVNLIFKCAVRTTQLGFSGTLNALRENSPGCKRGRSGR